ncbi:type I restriction endonuclease subunit R [Caminibacter mediatlanticus TB-2]|uniref:Type I restriction enzyme endonuclease subunit n=1 Tax=Caminibacter mediatlanticus TB-2 TaxID=391592 RepID=A0ABX5V8N0_9BACT|nr:type I restriction endonuclease subunit R [Caminibacter mediatlanticus]QCT94633.1 type I restriction endonuclease subunit R [Caminibacter mediatlanticus TB-2]
MYKPIAKTNNFIILDKFEKYDYVKEQNTGYQSEKALEDELIKDLINQGYIYRDDIKNYESLLKNVREKIEKLNDIKFSDSEWERFLKEYLDNLSDGVIEKTRKVHNDYIYDFVFDSGVIKNIYLFDKKNISKNSVEVIRQFTQKGDYLNRYDVTILVNGLPLVHIELKRRGVSIKEAFNQIDRYKRESFFNKNSLFKYIQIFVISNGTDTRYFANTTKREKNSFDFTINWATADNKPIKDLKDFTTTFFEKRTLLEVIFKYSVFDVNNTLLIMRPYQIAATERILWKIKSSYENKKYSSVEGGGYIWHTTGSGKTLTSFKTAQLATKLDFIDKVFFVVDRKDLDYQTMKEYQRFSPDSVNGSENTAGLKRNILKQDNKIIVTTIQKLNNLLKSEKDLEIYKKDVVFIFDEAHRSQFGEAQKNLKKRFKKYYQFGFTGTPIFPENALGSQTTASVFGAMLHSYVITDAIRDEKVLKFKVDYNNVKPKFKNIETEQDLEKLSKFETKEALLHLERIKEIASYILENFDKKTHRKYGQKNFNAIFAVSSVDAAKIYYETFKKLQENSPNPLKIATIFSYKQNEESAIGEIEDESFEVNALNSTAKEFLAKAINDYNKMFKTNFKVDGNSFQNYYRDLSKRVKDVEIDLLIVVGMFLTGFDAIRLNTLFVDKNLRYHGLIQAYSRTNRIYNKTKAFGNIVTFRDLEQATIDAIKLFGDKNTKNIILEKSYEEYLKGFEDSLTKEKKRGFVEIIEELKTKFPNPVEIEKENEKKEFVKLFSEYLKIENILQNFDEYYAMKELQHINNKNEVEKIKEKYHLDDETFEKIKDIKLLDDRIVQDYLSTYHDIREWIKVRKENEKEEKTEINWDNVVFEVDLLKSQEINLDYILELIFEKNKITKNKDELVNEIKKVIRASVGHRAKEDLIVRFINDFDLDEFKTPADIIEEFFKFAKNEMEKEKEKIIKEENLKTEIVNKYLRVSLKRGYASENGTELNDMLPKMSPLNPNYLNKKRAVFEKLAKLVEKFRGV